MQTDIARITVSSVQLLDSQWFRVAMAAGVRVAYNAEMGDLSRQPAAAEVDVWLRGGGRVVAASERAARAVAEGFHRARREEGLTAWPAPEIESWSQYVRSTWDLIASNDDRLVLNPAQEQSLWMQIIADSPQGKNLLAGPLQRMAKMAVGAHGLLCAYAPEMLKVSARSNWQLDYGAFSDWLAEFDRRCGSGKVISASRLPLELIPMLEKNREKRLQVLLAGFDRIQPAQAHLLQAWGAWRPLEAGNSAERKILYVAADEQAELRAVARWCKQKLISDSNARLMVVTQDLPARRGEFERMFLQELGAKGSHVEFSLGVPLAQVSPIRAAFLLLRWLRGSIEEHELDWLLGCGFAVNGPAETFALTGFMRALRRREMQRMQWRCEEFLASRGEMELPARWHTRMREAIGLLNGRGRGTQPPLMWAELVAALLQQLGWPGERALSSEEFQALRRWQHALDVCASLGFDGQRVNWTEFLQMLDQTLAETLFAPEARDASVVITGPAESAGLEADAIWFIGATEGNWPAAGSLHPLLPVGVQRDSEMPHAKPQLDWNLAQTITQRLLASAPEVCFSYARQAAGMEARPSRLAVLHAGDAQDLPLELTERATKMPKVEIFDDSGDVPLANGHVAGGSAVLNWQSQCPFKAFASARLRAEGWDPAQAGLSAMQRGELLHKVLHSVWGPNGIRSLAELKAITDLEPFVSRHVNAVFESSVPATVRERMPQAYLDLEAERITSLVIEWLQYELSREDFSVAETEVAKEGKIAELTLSFRLDRIDRLKDNSLLVIDYKTGNVGPSVWELPRADDVQLPLYAEFALSGKKIGGLVFAKLRKGEPCFAGKVRQPKEMLISALNGTSSLLKKPLNDDDLEAWHLYIEQMARDFLAGHAEANPIDAGKTCERCDLQTLCRIHESVSEDGDEIDEEAGNE
jgi:probable DNA repair protein